jgi:kinesin family member C2/C3
LFLWQIRSSSSGKHRRFRTTRELEEKTPITSRELYLSARKFKTPSPPVRSSLSAERGSFARNAENSGSIDCTPVSKVEALVKAPNSSSRNTPSSVLTAQNLRKFRDSEENRSKIPSVRQGMVKNRSDSMPKAQKEEPTSNRNSGAKVRSESKNMRDSSEIENEFTSDEPTFHLNRKVKKLPTQATRQSQNIDLRYDS